MPSQRDSRPVSHELFDQLLKTHVSQEGLVDYQGLLNDQKVLDEYLDLLATNLPNQENWTEDNQLAYWINAYNAFTVQLILDHYPVTSIRDIGGPIRIPFVLSPWDIKFIELNGKKYDLNNIEHDILRKRFDEPRIHFAINCASMSCPVIRPEAYTAQKLEEQLEGQAIDFLNDPTRNNLSEGKVELSRIFKWFGQDFTREMELYQYINQYTEIKLTRDTDIGYLEYNWSLNSVGTE